ncbi:putative S-protein [Cardamine amara subsp. amara]|uniref:S-protein n=1 Tax=Cardamine amara subsp. amara TaxID=228776 RepID=A0ABD0ZZX4_CARAN
MNRFLCFLFVMAFCVGLGDAKLFGKNHVNFKNSIGPGAQVKVFCKLNGKQLFDLWLNFGESYDYSFHGKFVTTNKMDCFLMQGVGGLKFSTWIRAFQGASGAFDHGKQNFWDCRTDGIYFTHGKDAPKLEYKWQ